MENNLITRFKNAWNAFTNLRDPPIQNYGFYGSFNKPDRPRLSRGSERSIVTAIINRIATDVSQLVFMHVQLDKNGRYKETVHSYLNECLTVGANVDQTSRAFIQDVVISLLDEGVIAIVPIETTRDPDDTDSYDILSLRTGKIVEWYPQHVKIDAYDERVAQHRQFIMDKRVAAIVENPFYRIMNEPNSTMQRLIRKLMLLDMIDENNSSGKLDLIIQLPYAVNNDLKRYQADKRRSDIEKQLVGSKYGIAYVDATEKITQLNRAVDNNLMSQVEYLTNMFHDQMGIDKSVLNGTANEVTMLNYTNRIVEPIASVIVEAMNRTFITKTARSQGKAIKFFRDPFKLVPINNIAEIADKFTRNEIMTSNEIRQIVGMRPSDDPGADELRNKNLNQSSNEQLIKQNNIEKTREKDEA